MLRLGLAQINTTVGDLDGNAAAGDASWEVTARTTGSLRPNGARGRRIGA
jgi:hypothetical protein